MFLALFLQLPCRFLLISYCYKLKSAQSYFWCSQILPNFLEQISCRDDTKNGKRVLTINPNQRLTSLKWRQEVLTRVHRLLTLLLGKNQLDPQRNSSIISYSYGKTCPLYMKRNFCIQLNIRRPGHLSVNDRCSPTHHLQEFISHLFPLLSETWVEAMASEQLNKNQGRYKITFPSDSIISSWFDCHYCIQVIPLLGLKVWLYLRVSPTWCSRCEVSWVDQKITWNCCVGSNRNTGSYWFVTLFNDFLSRLE